MAEAARLLTVVETKGVKKATDELDKFGDAANDADSGSASLTSTLKKAAPVVKATALATAGAVTALTAMAVKTANAEKEWQNLATVAATTTAEFKATAFAAEQFNISAEKLSDISKDVNEKLGEFVATGGGGFRDFFEEVAPKVGITADELQNLSGPQVLQRVKSAMDDANVSMEEQSFFLESIASDTTLLIPLLAQHGAEMERLTDRYEAANDALKLTTEQQAGLRELSTTFGLFTDQAGNAAGILSATLAPTLDSFFNDVIDVVPTATAALADFFNIFIATEHLATIKAAEERLAGLNAEIKELEGQNLTRGGQTGAGKRSRLARLKSEAEDATARIDELKNAVQQLEAQTFEGGRIGAGVGSVASNDDFNPDSDRSAEIAQWQAHQDEMAKREQESLQREKDLRDKFRDEELKADNEYHARLKSEREKEVQDRFKSAGLLFGGLADLSKTGNKKLNQIGKAASYANAVVNIAEGVTEALSLGPILGPAAAVGVSAAGAVQLAAIQNSAGNFENGGIVGGNSFSGDNITANVNSGEMILNRQQQATLFKQANGGGGGANIVINNTVSNDASVTARQDEDGRIAILVQRQLVNQVVQPNSEFNKALTKNRRAPRVF